MSVLCLGMATKVCDDVGLLFHIWTVYRKMAPRPSSRRLLQAVLVVFKSEEESAEDVRGRAARDLKRRRKRAARERLADLESSDSRRSRSRSTEAGKEGRARGRRASSGDRDSQGEEGVFASPTTTTTGGRPARPGASSTARAPGWRPVE